jgi:hypothetical protein
MAEVNQGQLISLKDDGNGFVSHIRSRIAGKKLYVLSLATPLGAEGRDRRVRLLVIPNTKRGKHYIFNTSLNALGQKNIVFHGEVDINDFDSDIINKAVYI